MKNLSEATPYTILGILILTVGGFLIVDRIAGTADKAIDNDMNVDLNMTENSIGLSATRGEDGTGVTSSENTTT